MTFLLSEDKALREKLQGMTVTDQKSVGESTPRVVGVWFGQPDQEIRAQSYPYIAIDMIQVARDPSREMRGTTSAAYLAPDDLASNKVFKIDLPIPMTIDYQITSFARHPRHDREIIAQLMYEKLPPRFGTLELDDGTARRMDVMDVSKRDVTEQAKRLYVNAITVRISSEVSQKQAVELYKTLEVAIHDPSILRAGARPGDPTLYGIGEFTIP
jgi:hypothetical protein